jgi:hypothetical protein
VQQRLSTSIQALVQSGVQGHSGGLFLKIAVFSHLNLIQGLTLEIIGNKPYFFKKKGDNT